MFFILLWVPNGWIACFKQLSHFLWGRNCTFKKACSEDNLRSRFRALLIFSSRNMKWDTYSTWGEVELFPENRRFCYFTCTVCVRVGYARAHNKPYACAHSQAFNDRYAEGDDAEKCETWSTEGTEYILLGREAVTRRRGHLRLTDSEVGDGNFQRLIMNFKYPKIEGKKKDICSYWRTLYSELRMLFYWSNTTPTERRAWALKY